MELSTELAIERGYGTEVPWVTLARADHFADALAGAPLTAFGPLLFTDRDELPERTGPLIEALPPEAGRLYVLGGPAAVSDDVVEREATTRRRGRGCVLRGAARVAGGVRGLPARPPRRRDRVRVPPRREELEELGYL